MQTRTFNFGCLSCYSLRERIIALKRVVNYLPQDWCDSTIVSVVGVPIAIEGKEFRQGVIEVAKKQLKKLQAVKCNHKN